MRHVPWMCEREVPISNSRKLAHELNACSVYRSETGNEIVLLRVPLTPEQRKLISNALYFYDKDT